MERAGIDIVTDGEIRRESYFNHFANALDGVKYLQIADENAELRAYRAGKIGALLILSAYVVDLLTPGRVRVTHADLVELDRLPALRDVDGAGDRRHDEQRDAPVLELTRVEFRMENRFGRHRFGLTGAPPAEIAAPIDLRGEFVEAREARRWRSGPRHVQHARAAAEGRIEIRRLSVLCR